MVLLGRSLATNLLGALRPTLEQVSRRQGQPVQTELLLDEGVLLLVVVDADGEIVRRLPVSDLLGDLLFQRGRLHPLVAAKLTEALDGDEHHATRKLVELFRSRPVLEGLQRVLLGALK